MDLKDLIVITGKPGIYKMNSQTKGGLIVESLQDKKKFPIHNIHQVSSLNDIAIYTDESEVLLKDVFKTIYKKEAGKETINHKESKEVLTKFFTEILPNYDTDRVYPSNIKKVVQWYNLLINVKFDFTTLEKEEEASQEEE